MLTIPEAAVHAGVSDETIRRRIRDGALVGVQQGARTKVRSSDVDRLFSPSDRSTPASPRAACRIIGFSNQKGGVGKTSTCANLAAALAQTGARVLAIDCDPQGNLTQALGPDPDGLEVSLYNVMIDRVPVEKAILSPVLGIPTLSLVGANLELASVDLAMGGQVAREFRLRQALEPQLEGFDYVLLDCPPALGLLTLNVLSTATEIIVPVDMGVFSLRGVEKLMDTISEVRSINPALRHVYALPSKADNTNLSSEVIAMLKQGFGEKLLSVSIPRSVRIGEAQARRIPIILHSPRDKASIAYLELARIIGKGPEEDGA